MKKIIMLIALLCFILVGCSSTQYKKLDDYGLSSITSESQLKKLIKDSTPRNYFNWFGAYKTEVEDTASPNSEYQSSDYTKTNVQVEGVDEGDIAKTDGSRLYSISYDRLQVIKLLGEGQMEIILNKRLISEAIDDSYYYSRIFYSELYLTDDFLVAIGQIYDNNPYYYDDNSLNKKPAYYETITSFIEIYDKESLEKVDFYEISGWLLGSRLINNNLYLISNYEDYNYKDDYDIRPWYKHNEEIAYFPYEDIKYIPNSTHRSFTIISTIALEKDDIKIDNDVFLSASRWGEIYVSTKAIYFACRYYNYSIFGISNSTGLIVSYQIDEETGEVFFGGYGNYDGSIIDQFAMDEYNGYLRVATTDGWGNNVKNRLYIFKREFKDNTYSLKQISLIDSGIGKPGERIQSVRFNKELVTIVTFQMTDPLYTIDLSDPYNPKIVGQLEIPGFSTYQHPWTDTLVIGIGFDTDQFGITTGVKISLFDISDINNPQEIGESLIFKDIQSGYNYSESTSNHKAIMIDKSRNCIGIPFTTYPVSERLATENKYLILDIDETRKQPIQVKHILTHDNYYKDYNYLYQNRYFWFYDFEINRAFRVDDYLYLLSSEVITSHNLLGDLSVVDEIIFEIEFIKK